MNCYQVGLLRLPNKGTTKTSAEVQYPAYYRIIITPRSSSTSKDPEEDNN